LAPTRFDFLSTFRLSCEIELCSRFHVSPAAAIKMQTKSAPGALFVLAYICNKLKSSVNCTRRTRRILNVHEKVPGLNSILFKYFRKCSVINNEANTLTASSISRHQLFTLVCRQCRFIKRQSY